MNKLLKDTKRRQLVAQSEIKRLEYKYLLNVNAYTPYKTNIQKKINKLSRNTSKTRIKNYCIFTGRSKGVYRDFKMSRIVFRELALSGHLPGIRKASW